MALAEIPEASAPQEVAALYGRLRAGQGMPLVNLIWRHLATMPGVLAWAVAATEPVLRSAALVKARRRVAAAAVAEFGQRLALGAAPDGVLPLLDAYDRGNSGNLVLLTALRDVIASGAVQAPVPLAPASTPSIDSLPVIPPLSSLPPDLAALVQRLAARHGLEGGIIPSLYLHLAHWPDLLAALEPALAPAFASGAVIRARDAAVAEGQRAAAELQTALAVPGPFPEAYRAPVVAVLTTFTSQVIPAMVPIGAAIRAGLDKKSAIA